MDNIKLDKYQRRLNKKVPTLLTMPILSFEKAAFLWKRYKTQLAVFLFLLVLYQLVTPSLTVEIC